jgi:hypothetical protein
LGLDPFPGLADRQGNGMLLTEHGLRFEREEQDWRCVDHPWLRMTNGCFEIDGEPSSYQSIRKALVARTGLRARQDSPNGDRAPETASKDREA